MLQVFGWRVVVSEGVAPPRDGREHPSLGEAFSLSHLSSLLESAKQLDNERRQLAALSSKEVFVFEQLLRRLFLLLGPFCPVGEQLRQLRLSSRLPPGLSYR